MKKKYLILLMTTCTVAAAAIGATLAARSEEGVSVKENISEKTLGVTDNSKVSEEITVIPGAKTDVSYFVTNDGGMKNNTAGENGSYDIYAKVFVYYDWEQSEDGKEYGELKEDDDYTTLCINTGSNSDPDYVEIPKAIESYNDQVVIGDWIVAYSDNEQMVLYYTKPLAKDEVSSQFLSQIKFDTAMDNRYVGANLNIETEVHAVQADSAVSAIASEWGVFPKFETDKNGVKIITSVSEEAE